MSVIQKSYPYEPAVLVDDDYGTSNRFRHLRFVRAGNTFVAKTPP